MSYICNPLNISYRYQFNQNSDGRISVSREAADPSLIEFKGSYYLFPSMSGGCWHSDDLVSWQYQLLPELPAYDYAPDVRVVGDQVYFCASNHDQGTFYRTKDPLTGPYEKIDGAFPFWDPNLFYDDDGRLYFYWGSSTTEPIYGVELNPVTLRPISEKVSLFTGNSADIGFERYGENHRPPRSPAETAQLLARLEQAADMPDDLKAAARSYILGAAYLEGVWMNKHRGRYYLQYATPSSGHNIYADGVYISDQPLGPFTLADNNPFSYKPGGFMPGAGHGSTMADRYGNLWHIATSRIALNHNFERRISLWPAGWDQDGELFCNQRFGDWPLRVEQAAINPWARPDWMLLSYGKTATASSSAEQHGPAMAVDENIRTWWRAASAEPEQWLMLDLGRLCAVHAIQINFADDQLVVPLPEGAVMQGALHQSRWIDLISQATRWLLEGSADGVNYFVIEDKSQAETDLPHDLVVREQGVQVRFIRLTVISLPYGQAACVSGLRVFGLGQGDLPEPASNVVICREGDLDMVVSWQGNGTGYVVNWGHAPDKLYHSCQVFGLEARIGGLVKGQPVFVRVDSFNECGLSEGI